MTRQEQMEKSTFLKVPYELVRVDHGMAILYGILLWLVHNHEGILTTYNELADIVGRNRDWVRDRLYRMREIGLVALDTSSGKGVYITVQPIGNLPIGKIPIGKKPMGKKPIGKIPTRGENTHDPHRYFTHDPYRENTHGLSLQTQSGTALDTPLRNKEIKDNIYSSNRKNTDDDKVIELKLKPQSDPVREVIQAYNEIYAKPLGRKEASLRVSKTRKMRIRALLKEHTLEDFRRAFEIARDNPFLRGDKTRFRFTLGWLLEEEDRLDKILEGYYDENDRKSRGTGSRHNYQNTDDDTDKLLSMIDSDIEKLGENL